MEMSAPPETLSEARAKRYIATCGEYTDPSEYEALVEDWKGKARVADQVVADFTRRIGPVAGRTILDIGFGNGQYAIAFARADAAVSGIEVNETLHAIAEEMAEEAEVSVDLRLYDGARFPYPDDYFQHTISVSVLEHVSDPALILSEAARVLAPGGTFYLAFPNRWRPREGHTHLFFIGYLPRSLANLVMRRVFGRTTIDDLNLHFLSYGSVARVLRTIPLTVVPETQGAGWRGRLKRALWTLGIHHTAILGTVMLVLRKDPS